MTVSQAEIDAAADDNYALNIFQLRRRAKAVYLACDESIAADLARYINWAADELQRHASGSKADTGECPFKNLAPTLCAWPNHDTSSGCPHGNCPYQKGDA